eukprot:scaffold5873_cov172-Amphora_coffeaeformis.AAC.1
MTRKKGKVLVQTSLYSEDCLAFLQQALAEAGTSTAAGDSSKRPASKSRYASSSEEEEDEDSGSVDSGEDSDESSSDEATGKQSTRDASSTTTKMAQGADTTFANKTKVKLEKFTKRQSDVQVRKYVDALTCHNFQLRDPADSALCLSTAMLSKDDRLAEHPSVTLEAFRKLYIDVQQAGKPIIVFFVRSGRFAGAVFLSGECIQHRTTTRYTIRKGQGKAQSAQDSQRRAKSIGSQLRRQGEEKLQEDITETATAWKAHVDKAALFFVSCPKTMKKSFYESLNGIISRDDTRIRRVPLDLGRPTFESAVLIHDVLCTVTVREMIPTTTNEAGVKASKAVDIGRSNQNGPSSGASPKKDESVVVDIPLSALHVACKNGDLDVIRGILASASNELTVMAGPDLMTPLHYAAASSSSVDPSKAADCVTELLTQGADPCAMDGRTRPPYFLASQDRVRDAFRIARANLGEGFCDWEVAKVGPPLTTEDIQQRKDKEAEKRKKKKARQKQKKAQEKAAADEAEQKRQEAEENAKQAEEAKRIRDVRAILNIFLDRLKFEYPDSTTMLPLCQQHAPTHPKRTRRPATT